jgi:hypothetical protein
MLKGTALNIQKIARLVIWSLLLPAAASAQVTGANIAGVVRDTSGAVLPGVTIEAASPALIEKVRTVVRYSNQNNQWQNVLQILGGRLVKLGVQLDF